MSHATDTPNLITATEDRFYEVVDGQKVEPPPMGAWEAVLASLLNQLLGGYCLEHELGLVVTEILFRLGPHGPQRRPDVAFVSFARWPRGKVIPPGDAWDVVPELAVEVISPSNKADEVMDRIRDYFAAGVQRVWVIYPRHKLAHLHGSPMSSRIIGADGFLEGEEILSGFRLPLTEIIP